MNSKSCFLLGVFAGSFAIMPAQSSLPGRGQTKSESGRLVVSPDEAWNTLRDLGNPRAFSASPEADAVVAGRARQRFAASLVDDADKLKEFAVAHPTHANAKEARRLEAWLLVQAWQAGDAGRDARRSQLVSAVRGDRSISAAKRAELATLADHVAVGKRRDLGEREKLLAFEQVNRGLTAEFPELPDAYESLVRVAKDSPPARAQIIARDLLSMPAPPAIKAQAQTLLDRYALIGTSLPALVNVVLGPNNPIDRSAGRRMVVYAWASFSKGSVALAKDLAARGPADATLIGVCLDHRDLAPARAKAAAENLPGEQIYDWLGRQGELAQILKLVDPGLVLVTDAAGVIRSVSSPRDPAALSNL